MSTRRWPTCSPRRARANELGEHEERDAILTRARESTPQADFAIELVRAELQQAADQWARSIATLNALRQSAPRHPTVLKRLLAAHEKLGDWEAVSDLAPSLPKDAAPDMAVVQAAVWRARFAKSKISADAAEHARKAWKAMPRKLRADEELLLDYVDALSETAPVDAEATLRSALKKDWRDAWVRRYAGIDADAAKQLAIARQWSKRHPDDPALLLTMAKLAARAGDVDQAKTYYQSSIEHAESAEALAELGLLHAQDGKQETAIGYFTRALTNPAK